MAVQVPWHAEARARPGRIRHLIAATLITSLGDGVALVAFSLLAVRLTSDPILVAGVTVTTALPWLLVALPIGAFVDRVDRRSLVICVEAGRAALLALAALAVVFHRLDIVGLYAVVFLVGVGETATSAVTNSVVPLIVDHDDKLPEANGNLQAAESIGANFVGPAVGGVIFSIAASLPLLGDAVSFICSSVMLGRAVPARTSAPRVERGKIRREMATGMRWLLEHAALRPMTGTIGSLAFCQAMVFGVLVLYCTRVLHLGPRGYGLILGVSALGNVAGKFMAKRAHAALGAFRTILLSGVTAAAAYLLLGGVATIAVAGFALCLETVAVANGKVAVASLRQRLIPTERFGITINAMRLFIMGLGPVGALVGGALADTIGTRATFAVAGVLQFVLILCLAGPLHRGLVPAIVADSQQVPTPGVPS
jgi:MFS family permease